MTNSPFIRSFPPLVDNNTHVLVIGSMPGKASLQAQEYYAYKHNQFWKLIFDIFELGRTPKNYADKIQVLLSHHIGLWDSLAACTRPGSLDSHIQSPLPNDFKTLFHIYPSIHTLLFNGQTAAHYFKKFYASLLSNKTHLTLPSTSPAHASISYLDKKLQWKQALQTALKKSYEPAHELL